MSELGKVETLTRSNGSVGNNYASFMHTKNAFEMMMATLSAEATRKENRKEQKRQALQRFDLSVGQQGVEVV